MRSENIKTKAKTNETLYVTLILICGITTAAFALKKGGLNTLIFEIFSIPIIIHGLLSIYFAKKIIKQNRGYFGGIFNKILFLVFFLICTLIYFMGSIQNMRIDLFLIFILFLTIDISNLLSIFYYIKLKK